MGGDVFTKLKMVLTVLILFIKLFKNSSLYLFWLSLEKNLFDL